MKYKLNKPILYLLLIIFLGLSLYSVKNLFYKNPTVIQNLSELPISKERKTFLISKELIRRSLKNPTDAKFFAPYRTALIVSNDVIDVSDTNEVASILYEDYWKSEGLVDAYATIGNKERVKWVVILDANLNFVYSSLDEKSEGTLPVMSKKEKRNIEEFERQERIREEKEKAELEKRKRIQKEIERLENEERIRLEKEKKKKDMEERIRKFRESRGITNN